MTNNDYFTFSKPSFILNISNNIYIYFIGLITILLTSSIYIVSIVASFDVQQKYNYLIIYVHLPSAWISISVYILITISAILYLINKNPLAHLITRSGLVTGTIFTLLTLISGSLWGKPMWGTYWVWDVRLTFVLLLFFIYILNTIISFSYKDINNKISSVFIVIGFINIPIIKLSVNYWNTLHQASSITQLKSNIHISMLIPILYTIIAFYFIACIFAMIYLRKIILERKIYTYLD